MEGRNKHMESTPVNWEALDALIIDFVRTENLVEDAFSDSSPSPLSSASISSSSYHDRLTIWRIRSCIGSGDIEAAIDLLRSHAPFVLADHRLLFRLQKQKFIELLRKGTAEDREAAIGCLRTSLAPSALDAYPEAYEEFKHVLLALIYDKDDQISPVANEWAEKRRYEMAGLVSSVLRACLQAYDPAFSMTLRYLISIHKGFCFRQGIVSPVLDLTQRLLLEDRDAPGTPRESLDEAAPFDEVDIQALAHAVDLTRQGAVESMRFAKGDLYQAFQNELCRMQLDVSMLDELVKEFCIYRGIVESEIKMIDCHVKGNRSEVGYSLSRDCSSSEMNISMSKHSDVEHSTFNGTLDGSPTHNADMFSKQGADVESRYGSESTGDYEDCSNGWSHQCEHTRTFLRNRLCMTGAKRMRWRGRQADVDYVNSESDINLPKGQQEKTKRNLITDTSNTEGNYEVVLGLKELASRGMATEVVDKISSMDPDFFTQNPVFLFHLKQVEFLKLASAGNHNDALKVACSHLGPLAASNPSLLKTLKETLLALLQPDQDSPGKEFRLNALANSIQVEVGRRVGIEEPRLMKIIRATLHTHTEWFKIQKCKDRFEDLLKIDTLKGVNPNLIDSKSKSNMESCVEGSSLVTSSSSTLTPEDGCSSTHSSSRDVLWEETAILKVMEFLALPRADAIQLLSQYNGNPEAVIQQLFG